MSNLEYTNVKEMLEKITLMINRNMQIVDGKIEGKWFIAELGSVANGEGRNYNLRIKTLMPI